MFPPSFCTKNEYWKQLFGKAFWGVFFVTFYLFIVLPRWHLGLFGCAPVAPLNRMSGPQPPKFCLASFKTTQKRPPGLQG